jgi:glycosyltransferase involved in cell wall biosynthesis
VVSRRPKIGVLANTLEGAAGVNAGGTVHFVEVVRRWSWADIVLFAPESAREALTKRVPDATFVSMPSWDGALRNRALLFLYRSFFGFGRWKSLRACDALVATSQFLPDVLPAIVRPRRTLLIVHHLIASATERDGPYLRNLIAFAAERVSLFVASRTVGSVACSSLLAEAQLRALGFRQPIAITTSGVDHIPAFRENRGPRSGAVFVGRLHPTKGVDDLIYAWRRVVDAMPAEVLTLIGASDDATFEARLDALVVELGLEANVRKLGRVEDEAKVAALFEARAFVFASKEEGWGIAVAEAMRAGLPCATYALPVFDEVFPKGRVVAPIGDVAGLARNIVSLLGDDALNARLASEAAALAEDFSWQRAAEIEGECLRSLVGATDRK